MAGIEYLDGELESLTHPDGRLTKTPEGWRTEYHHKDHLGNLRVAFADLDGDGRISHNVAGLPQELLQDNHGAFRGGVAKMGRRSHFRARRRVFEGVGLPPSD